MTTATQTDKRIRRYTPLKRTLDILLSGIGILVLSPILLILCIAIKLDSPGPVLFRQKRVGIHKTHFQIYKFRTMRTDTPKDMPTHMLNNPEQYITHTGRFLRKTSLDELPQIFNIFKGDMSIVGPRPALWTQYDLIAERDKYGANDILPGLTGWAQINGRDELEIPVKIELLTGYTDVRKAAETITEYGAKIVLITLGEKGSFVYLQDQQEDMPDSRAVSESG